LRNIDILARRRALSAIEANQVLKGKLAAS